MRIFVSLGASSSPKNTIVFGFANFNEFGKHEKTIRMDLEKLEKAAKSDEILKKTAIANETIDTALVILSFKGLGGMNCREDFNFVNYQSYEIVVLALEKVTKTSKMLSSHPVQPRTFLHQEFRDVRLRPKLKSGYSLERRMIFVLQS